MKFSLKTLSFILCAAVVSALFPFSACNAGGQAHFTAFNKTAVTVQSRNKTLSDGAAEKIRDFLFSLNAEFSATETESAVYKINAAAVGEETEISERFLYVAETCGEMRDFTENRFDPSVYPLTLLWKFAPDYPAADFAVPSESRIAQTLALVGYDNFSFGKAAVKSVSGAKIDFGGALKGYAADKIAEIMKDDGVTEGFVNVGGSSLYIISADNLSVVHPRKDGAILKIKIKDRDLSVSTSGDYEKNYEKDGEIYSHIIDPVNGYPQNTGVASATVIGKNGLKLDALTTAMCLFKHDFDAPENGELYKFMRKITELREYGDAQIFAVCIDGDKKQILTNKKQGEDFTLLDDGYTVVYLT